MIMQFPRRLVSDRALNFSLAGRVWQTLSGPVTIVLIIATLTPAEQGIYYALISIVGLQAFFELGLLNVLISYSAREANRARTTELASSDSLQVLSTVEPVEPLPANRRLASMMEGAVRWFRGMSSAYAVFAIGFGLWTLSSSDVDFPWLAPLVALILVSAVNIALAPMLAVLEGVGLREDIYRCRLWQFISGSLAVWLSLLLGWGLWALVLSSSVQTAWAIYITHFRHAGLLNSLRTVSKDGSQVSWASDIIPAQWRMAAISVSQYMATQLLVIIVLKFGGAENAGRLGMTLAITSALQIIAQTWLQANFPVISADHGAGVPARATAVWRRAAVTSTAVLAAGLLAVWGGVVLLGFVAPQFGARFLAPYQIAILALGCLANHQISVQVLYVLAKSTTPLARPAVAGFLVTAASVWLFGSTGGTDGVLIAFACGLSFVTLPLHTLAFMHYGHGSLRSTARASKT